MNYRFYTLLCASLLVGCSGCSNQSQSVKTESDVSVTELQACTSQSSVVNPSDSNAGWQAMCLPAQKPASCEASVYAVLKTSKMLACDQSSLSWVSASASQIPGSLYCLLPYTQGDKHGHCVPATKPAGKLCTTKLYNQVKQAQAVVACDKIVAPLVDVDGYDHCVFAQGENKFCLPTFKYPSCPLKSWQTIEKKKYVTSCPKGLRTDVPLFTQIQVATESLQQAQKVEKQAAIQIKGIRSDITTLSQQIEEAASTDPSNVEYLKGQRSEKESELKNAQASQQSEAKKITTNKRLLAGYTVPERVNLGTVVQNIKGYTNCLSVGPGGQVCQPNKKPLQAACTDKIWQEMQGVGGYQPRC